MDGQNLSQRSLEVMRGGHARFTCDSTMSYVTVHSCTLHFSVAIGNEADKSPITGIDTEQLGLASLRSVAGGGRDAHDLRDGGREMAGLTNTET